MNPNHYSVKVSEKGNTFATIHFSNLTPRESLESALDYVKYAIENGFDCAVKRGDEIIGTYSSK